MKRRLANLILKLFGWNTNGVMPPGVKKAVVIVAPHTSYWDFVIGRLTFFASGTRMRVLIKKESFVFPLGILLKSVGAIPVDRGKKNNMVDQVVQLFNESVSLCVVITPEGTRKLVRHWKKGFYMIAVEAKVPIALAFIDYGNKTGGIGPLVYPSGDFEKDMEFINNFYRDKTGKFPGQFNLTAEAFVKNESKET
jgi:1-acyl-sn-glycerol-3-phosphate acyltransferase